MSVERVPSARSYGGMSAEDRVAERRSRLLAAGLELIGTRGIGAATIRGVAEASGLAARYVYESFPTVEALHVAVFDAVAVEAAEVSVGALTSAPAGDDRDAREARIRAVLTALADLLLEDPRKGRVIFLEAVSSPTLGPRLREESRRFAQMLAATATAGDPLATLDPPPRMHAIAQFLIGGVGQSFAAALDGDVVIERPELVDVLVDLFITLERHLADLADQSR